MVLLLLGMVIVTVVTALLLMVVVVVILSLFLSLFSSVVCDPREINHVVLDSICRIKSQHILWIHGQLFHGTVLSSNIRSYVLSTSVGIVFQH